MQQTDNKYSDEGIGTAQKQWLSSLNNSSIFSQECKAGTTSYLLSSSDICGLSIRFLRFSIARISAFKRLTADSIFARLIFSSINIFSSARAFAVNKKSKSDIGHIKWQYNNNQRIGAPCLQLFWQPVGQQV